MRRHLKIIQIPWFSLKKFLYISIHWRFLPDALQNGNFPPTHTIYSHQPSPFIYLSIIRMDLRITIVLQWFKTHHCILLFQRFNYPSWQWKSLQVGSCDMPPSCVHISLLSAITKHSTLILCPPIPALKSALSPKSGFLSSSMVSGNDDLITVCA